MADKTRQLLDKTLSDEERDLLGEKVSTGLQKKALIPADVSLSDLPQEEYEALVGKLSPQERLLAEFVIYEAYQSIARERNNG